MLIANSTKTNWKFIGIVAILAVLVGGGILGYQRQQGEQKIELKFIAKTIAVFEGVPQTYEECMRTDLKYSSEYTPDRSKLLCSWSVLGDQSIVSERNNVFDSEKFKECIQQGGKTLTFAGDCTLEFYSPEYTFPKNYAECVDENRGEVITNNECIVAIELFYANNKDVAERLMGECRAMGGVYSESQEFPEFASCLIRFEGTAREQETEKIEPISESQECLELIPSHNNISKDRIDLVFIGFGYSSPAPFKKFAEQAIDFEAKNKGLFSIEPFRSNKESFNIWYVNTIGDSESKDLWNLSSLCRKKLGVEDHNFTPQAPLFSERMFTFILRDDKGNPATFYVPDPLGCRPIDASGRCGLIGTAVGINEENEALTKTNYHDFIHEFAHAMSFYNISVEYRPEVYYELLDEYERFPGPYSEGRDWEYIIRDHSNCFVGTYEQCMSPSENALFGDMIGDGCGKDGVVDCCTNNQNAIKEGSLACEKCPNCKEDPRYDLEISCYESCWNSSGIYRSTFSSIMRSRSGSQDFGTLNEKILCHQINLLTGKVGGICDQLLE